jgi:hypothetical protein
MVQAVPNYQSATVASGVTLSARAWTGSIGGVIAVCKKTGKEEFLCNLLCLFQIIFHYYLLHNYDICRCRRSHLVRVVL